MLWYAQGKDPGHKDCVLVKCREDPRTLFFDARQVHAASKGRIWRGHAVSRKLAA